MKTKLKEFKPALILAIITATAVTLVVLMNQAVQADDDELSGALREKCVELMGEGAFTVAVSSDIIRLPKSVRKIITHEDSGTVAFQVVTKGYNRDGLNMLIVMNEDGRVRDLTVVQNTETAGIGTKVEDRSFLDLFMGRSEDVRIVRGSPRNNNEIAAITGATKSARGVADAVNIAVNTYAELFGGEN
ncbi:MAG: FMN-binding protein [Oscillospiraceae bacterium]|nr:FMN-binding protein [Oscillospiraceae bacterium]